MKPDAVSGGQRRTAADPLRTYLPLPLGSMAFTLLLLEGILRLCSSLGWFPGLFQELGNPTPPFEVKTGDGLYYAHPYTSYSMKPGYYSAENGVRINSLGFRGREIGRQKPQGAYRIVCLGGSTTFSLAADDQTTYPALLEQDLRQMLATDRIEVINAGLVSASSAESMHRMLNDILPLDPDMIVFYEGFNDLPPRVFNGFEDDYYSFRRIPRDTFGLGNLYLGRLALRVVAPDVFSDNGNLTKYIWKWENLPADDQTRIKNFRATTSAAYKRNVENIVLMARARNISMVVGTFVFNEDARNWTDVLPDVLWKRGIGQNNRAITELAAQYDLPLVDFYTYGLSNPDIFGDSIHMNERGYLKQAAFFAETIAPAIAGELAAPAP